MSNLMFFKVPCGTKVRICDAREIDERHTLGDCFIQCFKILSISNQDVCIETGDLRNYYFFDDNFRPEHVWNPEKSIPANVVCRAPEYKVGTMLLNDTDSCHLYPVSKL